MERGHGGDVCVAEVVAGEFAASVGGASPDLVARHTRSMRQRSLEAAVSCSDRVAAGSDHCFSRLIGQEVAHLIGVVAAIGDDADDRPTVHSSATRARCS